MPPMVADNKPKRAATSYFLFGNSIREELTEANKKANNGKVKVAEVSKAIAERWGKLSGDEKAKFDEQAREGKEKHAVEMKAYKDATDPLGALKEKYADLIPKKPMGAYWIYAQDETERQKAEKALKDAGEEASHKKVTIKLGELWKALPSADKAPWEAKVKTQVAEYEEKKKAWEARPEYVEFSKVEKEQKAKEQEEKAKAKAEAKEEKEKEKTAAKEAAKEDKLKEKEAAKEAKKATKAASPQKRKAADGEKSSPEAKKVKVGKAGKAAKPSDPVIDADVLKQAEGLGLGTALKNLMIRPEVASKEFPHAKMLAELQKADGLVNKAKYALLGA